MTKRVSVARANARLHRELAGLHEKLDAHHAQPHPAGTPSCRPGCSACCRQMNLVELSEAEYLIHRNPDAVRRALPMFREHASRLASVPGDIDTEEGTALAARGYWRLNIPCALLDERGRCSVYADRPLACRVHFVASDPALCGTENPSLVQILDYGTRTAALGVGLRIALEYRSRGRRDADAIIGPLPLMIVRAVDERGSI